MTDQAFIRELKTIISQEVARCKLEELRSTDYTVARLMEEGGITEDMARRILNKLAREGLFIKVKVPNPNGGGARVAYRPVEKKEG